jgi:hypothetical protein
LNTLLLQAVAGAVALTMQAVVALVGIELLRDFL